MSVPCGAAPADRRSPVAYFLFLVFLVSAFNQGDRLLIGIVAQPIKLEFGLSDTLIGLLGGTAFALVYPPLGLPIAWYTDRANRRNVLAACVGLWSLMTAVCGVTTSYVQLLVARLGVAAGEAGFVPPTHSLMTDYVSARRRATGFSVIAAGAAIGTLMANTVGGYFTTTYGWRMAFIALGVPGVVLAVLVALTLREPPRVGEAKGVPPDAWPTIKRLLAEPAYVWCILGSALHLMLIYGMTVWAVPFYVRSFGLSVAKAGLLIGVPAALAHAAGGVAGGFIGDRLAARNRSWLAYWPALSVVAAVPFCLAGFLGNVLTVTVACLTVAALLNAMYQSPTYALVQSLAGARERATAAALMIFLQNLLGLGLGPLVVGFASDQLSPEFGTRALALALAGASLLNLCAGLAFLRSGAAMKRVAAA